ncbi:succinic semialdehyde dehydrogenase [Haloechinothrix sp. LS1_15]|uniref:succinic semialdehyde dehydrogenase n=1 Tax=Haloechinothrix sp. LS1_15 TaxID=2652248 RepID=UPI002944E5E5|nr:succinic semialdehyde dehydrogenase [Haloechinothrix sp. LS1_15]MDV6012924.1 succinate-semialdehyde dehydrogenase (NADP(+)) [Haloechinothrix sp. LS1_15]
MTSTMPAGAASPDAATSTTASRAAETIGGVPGAPQAARARELLRRTTGGHEAPTVAMSAPFTGEPIATLGQATDAEARSAFTEARAAQRSWSAVPLAERERMLLRLHDLVLERQQEAMDLIQVETGKARIDAFDEIAAVALCAAYYGRRSAKLLGTQRRAGLMPGLTKASEVRHPKGVVGIISPWNYPLALTALDVLPALVAGNAVVHKPDNQTALTALWLHEIAEEAGFPREIWQVLLGRGSTIGDALVAESDYVGFTGSTATGKRLAGQVAEQLTGFSLELGGKNPMVVLDDARVPSAAKGAVTACFSSAGQLCVSVERVYVHESIKEEFTREFVAATRRLRLGRGLDYSADMGSLTSQEQWENVSEHVTDARDKGATVLTGGTARPDIGPLFYEPTVLTDVTPEMSVYAEETFGPVVSIYGYTDLDDAVARANATPYGLNASVWTGDIPRGRAVASRIRAGTVNINEGFAASFASVDAPMGGMGESGVGRRNGAEGLLRYTESQSIVAQRGLRLRPFRGMPPGLWTRIMTASIRALRHVRR